ncbi:MAG: tRNA 2-thiouridine(34) synthase MnmA, partial [Dehalococcoidales bacterium]|nr:tRNA 2-thiouridine(34) synthase MnmA [Dehalococcoidales bacterium]
MTETKISGKRVVVAMSGGVDSLMAAALLSDSGNETSGVYLKLWDGPDQEQNIDALRDNCRRLAISLRIINLEEEFQELIIDYFCQEYNQGRTPNPCTICNKRIKFGLLLDRVMEMGADYLATGHYARIESSGEGYHLLEGTDPTKDQSYFLYRLGQRELKHLLFPLGSLHKSEVRQMAARRGLATDSPRESQDICFIPGNDYRQFLAKRITTKPGDITDAEGKVLGRHNGMALYTIGQRQGLGLISEERLYVLKLDPNTNRVIVGTRNQLLGNRLNASRLSWISGVPPQGTSKITAKIRYGSSRAAASLYLKGYTAKVIFNELQSAITPGQDVVFYQGSEVLGGGIIEGEENKES